MSVPAPVQAVVSHLVGHHVKNLQASCTPTQCVATDHHGLVVVLVLRGQTWVVKNAVD